MIQAFHLVFAFAVGAKNVIAVFNNLASITSGLQVISNFPQYIAKRQDLHHCDARIILLDISPVLATVSLVRFRKESFSLTAKVWSFEMSFWQSKLSVWFTSNEILFRAANAWSIQLYSDAWSQSCDDHGLTANVWSFQLSFWYLEHFFWSLPMFRLYNIRHVVVAKRNITSVRHPHWCMPAADLSSYKASVSQILSRAQHCICLSPASVHYFL